MQLTIFYDGLCPLCLYEMDKLQTLDKQQKLHFVDISSADFLQRYPQFCRQAFNAKLHGQLADGSMLEGLDVTYLAWKLVGKGWLYAPTRWLGLRWLFDRFYLFFARYRYPISYLLTRPLRCDSCRVKEWEQ